MVEVGAEVVIAQEGSAEKQRRIVAVGLAVGLAAGLELAGVVLFELVVNCAFVAHSSGFVDLGCLLLVRFGLPVVVKRAVERAFAVDARSC